LDRRYARVLERLRAGGRIVDLGCGNVPVQGATAAVDLHVDPVERALGHGERIQAERFRERGIRFENQRIDRPLPFADKEFDFAYSAHVFEHLEDPATACLEMMRVAKAGVIITPSIFAEVAFGRPYHRWLVIDGDRKLCFFPKKIEEDRPFGEHPAYAEGVGYHATPATNPFDIALDDGEWYRQPVGPETTRLRNSLRHHYYGHTPVMEVVFNWEDSFDFEICGRRD
jgi:SAM-dependent methyltransferase